MTDNCDSTGSWNRTKYSYDSVGRLSAVSEGSAWSRSYDADQFGNHWVSASPGLATSSATPILPSNYAEAGGQNTKNRLHIDNAAYDLAGRMTAISGQTFSYDGESRVATSLVAGTTTTYVYDGEGRRVKKVTSGPSGVTRTVVFVYGVGGALVQEYDTQGAAGSGLEYVAQDHLGSTRAVFNGAGVATRCLDYLPYGEQLPQGVGAGRSGGCWATDPNPRVKFTGKERDAETGLDYFGARYLSGVQGRFTSADPLNIPALQRLDPKQFAKIIATPQNWNGYAYSQNNPLNRIDPDGFLTIVVPGTWNQHDDWAKSPFRKQVEQTFGEQAVVLKNNNMDDTKQARSAAAKELMGIVANHEFAPGEKLNIVAHSHGGNVVAEATQNGIGHKIDTLVTLGTPIRSDYQFNESMVGAHLNVFSTHDAVQPLGGEVRDSGARGWGVNPYVLIPAGRQLNLPGVRNLDASSKAGGHSELWERPGTWSQIVGPEIKK